MTYLCQCEFTIIARNTYWWVYRSEGTHQHACLELREAWCSIKKEHGQVLLAAILMLVLQFNIHLSSFIQRGSQLWGYIQALFTMKDYISFILHLLKYGLDGAKVWTVMGGWCPKFWLSKGECTIPIEVFLQQNGVTFAWQVHTFPLRLTGPSLALFLPEDFANCVWDTIAAITQHLDVHISSDVSGNSK